MKIKTLKLILFFATIISTQISIAQWGSKSIKGNENVIEETRNLSSYTEIDISGSFDVELIDGTPGKISIVAESNMLEHIVTEVKKEGLSIGVAKKIKLQPTQTIKIIIPFKELEKLTKSGFGTLISRNEIAAKKFSLKLSGSSDVDLSIDASKSIKVYRSGSGDVTIEGQTKSFKLKSDGSGKFDAENLIADDVDIKLTGSGDVSVESKNKLKASVSGSGKIYYAGNPSKINTKVSGAGKIIKL